VTLSAAAVNRPLANSYWVQPQKFLAGEHPLTRNEEDSAVRLQDLLLAGVTCFVDLTSVDELPAYGARLPATFAGKPVMYHRFTIPDHDVPADPQLMRAILDVIDAALAADGFIYLHCRAGIGRTGTVVGCHLIRHGTAAHQAIDALNVLWQASARATSWPAIPETSAQRMFIRNYNDAPANNTVSAPAITPAQLHLYQGVLLGLAMGEVLGAARAAESNASKTTQSDSLTHLAELHWGSNAAMTLALADSLLACGEAKPLDQMQRYLAWQKQGRYSSHGIAEHMPPLVLKALGLWQWKRNPVAGSHDPAILDAHALTRCAAVALYFARSPSVAISEAAESARTTIQSPLVLDACRVFAALLVAVVEGLPIAKLLEFKEGQAFTALRAVSLKPEISNLIDGGWRTAMTHAAGEDVVSILASAIHALATTQTFPSAVFKSMHNAARAETVGAVCGALAGAWYGMQGLPIVWRETLVKSDELLIVAERLLTESPVA
jgi:ADP-ribosylglycohydrolase/protein-tyrosine phosphatase